MLEHFFRSKFLISHLRGNPGAELLDAFCGHLIDCGYSRSHGRRHLRAVAHLLYWQDQDGHALTVIDPDCTGLFIQHLDKCCCDGFVGMPRPRLLRGIRAFRSYLLGQPLSTAAHRHPRIEVVSPLWAPFCCWMREQRGTSERTLNDYYNYLQPLLRDICDDLAKLDVAYLRQFMLQLGRNGGNARAKSTTSALRMLVRFLIAQGRCTAGLDEAIPSVAYWRLSSLPQYLQPEEVERVISSPDMQTSVGKRDRAILLLLARLGLRAGEVVNLCLTDIDWHGATIRVCGKNKRQTLLPLTQEVGDAIVDYLQHGRPPTASQRVFIRALAPFRPYRDTRGVSDVAKLALRRAQVNAPSRGAAHVLRHSMATSMLRQSVSLNDISAVLRHTCLSSTEIYAKVDIPALQELAQPWPEAQSC